MEDSFNARVGKIFGSLNSSSSSSSSSSAALSSLWSLTDDEVEHKQWKRREESVTNEELEEDIEEEVEDKDKDKESQSKKPDDYNDEEWEVKSCIGLDCTLDFEEEEDEYDKVAVGDEDRLYMKDVEDYGIDIDSRYELPASVEEVVVKDPRANLRAARLRLLEDAHQGPLNPKSILKRKGDDSDSKPSKRVRFDPDCVDHHRNDEPIPDTVDHHRNRSDESIPDYMLNPSRYTRYTFDSSSDLDDNSNRQAYMDLLKKKEEEADALPRPVTFIPRKKAADTSAMVDSCTELVQQVEIGKLLLPTAIAAAEDTSVCAMEEDDQPPPSHNTKPARQYRLKPTD